MPSIASDVVSRLPRIAPHSADAATIEITARSGVPRYRDRGTRGRLAPETRSREPEDLWRRPSPTCIDMNEDG